MTKSKALKILNKYPGDTIIYKLYDFYKTLLEHGKAALENNPLTLIDSFSVREITISDVINLLNNGEDVLKVEYEVLSSEKIYLKDICYNIEKLVKNPENLNIKISQSEKEYNDYYEENKERIENKLKEILGV